MKLRTCFWALLLVSFASALTSCSTTPTSAQVLVKFQSLQRIPGSSAVAIILAEPNSGSFLPLSIDREQALSIYLGQNDIPTERPRSHDLMASLLRSLDATVERIVITDLRDNVYYAELELSRGEKIVKVDARPSDAIALALRVDAPIFAMQHLLDNGALPDTAEDAFSQVRVKSWGFTVQEVSGTLQKAFDNKVGVLVAQSEDDSPAQQAGLMPGDLIETVDGQRVADLEAFGEVMAGKAADDQIELAIRRGQERLQIALSKHN